MVQQILQLRKKKKHIVQSSIPKVSDSFLIFVTQIPPHIIQLLENKLINLVQSIHVTHAVKCLEGNEHHFGTESLCAS